MSGLPGYDAWLERPYQERAERGAAIEDYAERHDLPLETDEDWDRARDEMEGEAEAAAEDAAEARWEEDRLGY